MSARKEAAFPAFAASRPRPYLCRLMENPVIILGAQAVGTAALDAFLSNDVVVYCILDDDPKLHNTELLDVPVMGNTDGRRAAEAAGQEVRSVRGHRGCRQPPQPHPDAAR